MNMQILDTRVQELAAAPGKDELPIAGMRFAAVHYNKDAETGIKPKSLYFQIPAFRPMLQLSEQQKMAIYGLLDGMQHSALKEWIAIGYDPELLDTVQDLEVSCKEWNTDGRGERDGLKQGVIVEWVAGEFAKYLAGRLERNSGLSKEQKKTLLDHYVGCYKLAATRGNKGKDKVGKVTFVSLQKLQDLEQRMESYLSDPVPGHALQSSEITKTLLSRIQGHIAVLKAATEDAVGLEAEF